MTWQPINEQFDESGDPSLPTPITPEVTLRDRFRQLEGRGSPSLSELLELQKAINYECLQYARATRSAAQQHNDFSNIHVELAVYLSGPLIECENTASSLFREVQLRSLVAALALLHYTDVTKLHVKPYDKLSENISARFVDVVDGHRGSQQTSAGRLSRATAPYLIRLASQYFSRFKRFQPPAEAISIPVIGLILASASIVRRAQI